jgi:hypothetical protein
MAPLKVVHYRQEQELGGSVWITERVLERLDAWRYPLELSPSGIQPEYVPALVAHEQVASSRPAHEAW